MGIGEDWILPISRLTSWWSVGTWNLKHMCVRDLSSHLIYIVIVRSTSDELAFMRLCCVSYESLLFVVFFDWLSEWVVRDEASGRDWDDWAWFVVLKRRFLKTCDLSHVLNSNLAVSMPVVGFVFSLHTSITWSSLQVMIYLNNGSTQLGVLSDHVRRNHALSYCWLIFVSRCELGLHKLYSWSIFTCFVSEIYLFPSILKAWEYVTSRMLNFAWVWWKNSFVFCDDLLQDWARFKRLEVGSY